MPAIFIPATSELITRSRKSRRGWSTQSLCSLAEISGCIARITGEMADQAYSEREQSVVQMVLVEAITNAIKHGHHENPQKTVTLRHLVLTDHLWIEVEDEGDGFDPDAVPDPRLSERLSDPSGRGLLLMRSFMDHVEHANAGRTVLMSRRRRG